MIRKAEHTYRKKEVDTILSRISEPRQRIQVIMGPRQCGKTTSIRMALNEVVCDYDYYVADNKGTTDNSWILNAWEMTRLKQKQSGNKERIIVIDEIQKIKNWSEAVKQAWDEDTWNRTNIKAVILGSSRVMIQKGLEESLAGRFETIKMGYWDFEEMNKAFGMSLNEYIYFGGFPGLAGLIHDEERWREAVEDSIVLPMLSRDIEEIEEIRNPSLLRNIFYTGSSFSSRELSVSNLQTQINKGSEPTIASYLDILDKSMMLKPIQKASLAQLVTRKSIPKMQAYSNGFYNVGSGYSFEEAQNDPSEWGRQFESCIGAYLANHSITEGFQLLYWRGESIVNGKKNTYEVDYVLKRNDSLIGIEVKSGNSTTYSGITAFKSKFGNKVVAAFIVGKGGITLEQFFKVDLKKLFRTKANKPELA